MKQTTVYIDGGQWHADARRMFRENGYIPLPNPELADLLCLMGGADVNPRLYGEENVASFTDDRMDAEGSRLWERFSTRPKVGICRGGQFLNVMNGGRMWQDVTDHGGIHEMIVATDGKYHTDIVAVSSTHHQMMRPTPEGQWIGWAERAKYKKSEREVFNRGEYYAGLKPLAASNYYDAEVIFYPHTKTLCYQPHPEIGPASNVEFFFFCLHEYLEV